jgi:hypothetical protein
LSDANHDHYHGHDHVSGHGHAHSRHPLLFELREHVPFSVSAVAIGLIVAGTLCVLGTGFGGQVDGQEGAGPAVSAPVDEHDHEHDHAIGEHGHDEHGHEHGPMFARLFFHLFHPAHMLFSAAATSAMFFRYERKVLKASLIGLIGAIGVCGLSDIGMPHVSLLLLGVQPPLHLCVIEHPMLVLPFAVVGIVVGVATAGATVRTTVVSHSLHVLASTMASIFYMVGPLGVLAWIDDIGMIFTFVVLAVMVPCCLSDIVFPLLMSPHGRARYAEEPHVH